MEEKKITAYQAFCDKHRIALRLFVLLSMAIILIGAVFIQDPKVVLSHRPPLRYCAQIGLVLTALLFLISLLTHLKYNAPFKRTTIAMLFLLDCAIGLCLLLLILVYFKVENETFFNALFLGVLPTTLVVCLILSLVDVLRKSTISTKILSVAILCLILSQTVLPRTILYFERRPTTSILCQTNLKGLRVALEIYRNDYDGRIPAPGEWCDLLHQRADADLKSFQCPGHKIGRCTYALNENIPADTTYLPPDLVLLFESAPGWNQLGGVEDVVVDRHGKDIPGANIAFADGRVKFVKADEISNLRWKIEE